MSRQHSWHAHLRRFAFTSLLLLGVATSAFAQFDRGTITGTVKDAQGGIVPGVTVTLTSTQTQQVRSTVTDGSGFYTFPNLTAGRYEISAELSGFKKTSRSNVQLDAAGALSLDFTLETGALTEEVTVTAETTALQTQVAVRKSVEAKDIELLSFYGRNPIGVPALKAGVIGGNFNNAGFSSLTNGGFSVNGGRSDENNITIDGAVAIRTRVVGRDDRRPERRRDPGSPGPDGELHARIRPRQRRADPLRHQERQQPLQRQRLVLLSATSRCRRTPGRATEPERHRELRPGPVRLQAVRLFVRRPDPGQYVLRYAASGGDLAFAWLLNNDTVVPPVTMGALVAAAADPGIPVMCGGTLLHYDTPDTVQCFGGGSFRPPRVGRD